MNTTQKLLILAAVWVLLTAGRLPEQPSTTPAFEAAGLSRPKSLDSQPLNW